MAKIYNISEEREDFLNKKWFELQKTMPLSHDEKIWWLLNLLYEVTIDPHPRENGQVDTTLAHKALDRIMDEVREIIDSSNNRLSINPDYKGE